MVKEKVPDESRGNRFKRLATARTNAVLKKLHVLGNCSNKSAYSYSSQDIDKVFSAIEKEVKKTKARFEAASERRTFNL
jgi:ribosome-associated translation inhibitor RaiA